MSTLNTPADDAKIGSKIDYLAKCVAVRLKPEGFKRRGRLLYREQGAGDQTCVQTIDLQGDKWNQGACGRFTVNMAVCFPAILALLKGLPGLEWVADHGNPYSTAIGPGGAQARLSDAMGDARSPEWPENLRAGEDFWAEIDARTDLSDLAKRLATAIADIALPWLDGYGTLSTFANAPDHGFGAPGPRDRILAALLAADAVRVAQLLGETPPHRLASGPTQFEALQHLLKDRGIAVTPMDWADPKPHPMQPRRAAIVAELSSTHLARVEAFLAAGTELSGRDDAFLDAWVEESAANQLATSVTGFRLWAVATRAELGERRGLLVRLLRRFSEAGPAVASTVANVWASYENYHRSAWHELADALLKLDDQPCDAEFASALLEALAGTVSIVEEGLTSDTFKAPVAHCLAWLDSRCPAGARYAAKPAAQALFDSIRTATLMRNEQRLDQPPPVELLGEALAEQVLALYTPEARSDLARLYGQCPERSYAGADRAAVLRLSRWLRAEPDGRVPLLIESDDWGNELQDAMQKLESQRREAMLNLLEWFDASATAKPSKRWRRELDERSRIFPAEWLSTWLHDTLPRFERTTLKHFLSAPGFLAFPGETSERLLLGLVHLAGQHDPSGLMESLQAVARAAFMVVPDQRIRAYAVGIACLSPLSASAKGKAALTALRASIRQKNVRAAIDKVLSEAP